MRGLVTGASGYIGAHVVSRLVSSGHRVTALVRAAAKLDPRLSSQISVVTKRLDEPWLDAEEEALRAHDACIDLAVLWSATGPHPELEEVSATVRLFDALGRAGVPHVLYASSAAVHRPFTARMTESDRIVTADA